MAELAQCNVSPLLVSVTFELSLTILFKFELDFLMKFCDFTNPNSKQSF